VNGISEALRQELLEHNIRVTMVEPGAVETELPDHITDEEVRAGGTVFSMSWIPCSPRT